MGQLNRISGSEEAMKGRSISFSKRKLILRWSQIQIKAQNPPTIRFLDDRIMLRRRQRQVLERRILVLFIIHGYSVSPHMTPECLPYCKLQPTYGAIMGFRLQGRRGLVSGRWPRLLVACTVAAKGLERREPPITRLAFEYAIQISTGSSDHGSTG